MRRTGRGTILWRSLAVDRIRKNVGKSRTNSERREIGCSLDPRSPVAVARVPLISGFFRIFPTFPAFSGCVRPPQNCSLSCSSHFQIFPVSPTFSDCSPSCCSHFRIFPGLSGSFRLFRLFPDAFGRHKIGSFPVPLISGFFRFLRLFPIVPLPAALISGLFRIFPTFSDVFRMRSTASDRHKIVPLSVLLISGILQLFRLFPDVSDRHKIVPLPVPLILFRMRPAATKLTGPLVV